MPVDIIEVKEFVKSDKFSQFLLNNTTDFYSAAFILQVLLDKIAEVEDEMAKQAERFRNADKHGEWEINPDGYYPQCPFCRFEPEHLEDTCPNCGANLNKEKYNGTIYK